MARAKKLQLLLAAVVLACGLPAWSDDGIVLNTGGGLEPVASTDISMYREDLDLAYDQTGKKWQVSVTFIFLNTLDHAIESDVAFINHSTHDERMNGDIANFRTWINDAPRDFKYSRNLSVKGGMWPVYDEFFTTHVRFESGYTKISHRYDFVGSLGWGPDRFGFEYSLLTARKWKGPIGTFNYSISLPPNSILTEADKNTRKQFEPYGIFRKMETTTFGFIYFRQGGYFYSQKNFIPTDDITLEIYDWDWYLSEFPVFKTEEFGQPDYEKPRVSFLDLRNKPLRAADLSRYQKPQLRILRNAVYALHGYQFTSADLTDFFNRFIWYLPRPDFAESEFNQIEKANIKLLADLERS